MVTSPLSDTVDSSVRPELSLVDPQPVAGPAGEDTAKAEAAVADLLSALGRDVRSEHLAQTPRRVVAALKELLTPQRFTLTTFPNDSDYAGLVLVRDIPFHSLCEHHLLPFRGRAHVGYLPGDRLVGLSKLARVVDLFARDLQVQERLTTQIADYLDAKLVARGVGVMIEAEHLCMSIRGAHATGALTTTHAYTGEFLHDLQRQRDFAAEVRGHKNAAANT